MNIPNFLNDMLTDRNGYMTDPWSLILQQLFSVMQENLSDEGFGLPRLTTAQINALETQFNLAPDPSVFYGRLLYDVTTDEAKINIAGTFKVVQVV